MAKTGSGPDGRRVLAPAPMKRSDGWTVMLSVAEFFRPRRAGPEEPEQERPPFVQYQDTSFIPRAPVKTSRRLLPGLFLAIVGLAVVLASMFLPWYSYTISGKVWVGNTLYEAYDRSDYSFNGIRSVDEMSTHGFTMTNSSTRSWGEYEKQYASVHDAPPQLSGVYSAALLLVVAAVTLCALGMLLAVLFRMRKRSMRFPAVVLLVGALVALTAAGAFFLGHPPAARNDGTMMYIPPPPASPPPGPHDSFSGEYSRQPLTFHWGPALGWYLCLGAPFLMISGALLLHAMNRGRSE